MRIGGPARGRDQTDPPDAPQGASFVVDWQGAGDPELPGLVITIDTGLPENPAGVRSGAVPSPEMVNVLTEVTGARRLNVVAWVNNVAYRKDVWLDLYGFDARGNPVNQELLVMRYEAPAGGGGDLFGGHTTVGADVAAVAYRIYYEVDGTLYTEGVLHTAALPGR